MSRYEGLHRWAPGMATADAVAAAARREAPKPVPTWGGRPGDPGLADAPTGQLQALESCARCGQPLKDANCPDECDCDDEPEDTSRAHPMYAPRRAATVVAFLRGVRRGRRAAAAEGVTAERFGLPLSGRGPERSTAALAERYGASIWQGDDASPLDRSGDDVRRPWM